VSKKALREEIARLSAEGEREAQVVRALAKAMGDDGYCNYDACANYLRSAYQAGYAAGRASLQSELDETRKALAKAMERHADDLAFLARLRKEGKG
jgi:hypothetical protein